MILNLRSIIASFGNRTSTQNTVIVDWEASGRHREISTDLCNGECNKSKPFDGAEGEPLHIIEGDGERDNLRSSMLK
jgi:hypothetical protein